MKSPPLSRALLAAVFLLAPPLGFTDDLPNPWLPPRTPLLPLPELPAPWEPPPVLWLGGAQPQALAQGFAACGEFRVSLLEIMEMSQDIADMGLTNELLLKACGVTVQGDSARAICSVKERGEQGGVSYLELGGNVVVDQEPPAVASESWRAYRNQARFTALANCVQEPGGNPAWVIWKKELTYHRDSNLFTREPPPRKTFVPRYLYGRGSVEQLQRVIEKSSSVNAARVLLDQKKYLSQAVTEGADPGRVPSTTSRSAQGQIYSSFKTRSVSGADSLDTIISARHTMSAAALTVNALTAYDFMADKKRGFLDAKGAGQRWDELLRGTVAMRDRRRESFYGEIYFEDIGRKTVADASNRFRLAVQDRHDQAPSACLIERQVTTQGMPGRLIYPHQRGIVSDPQLPYLHNDPALLSLPRCPP